MTKDLTGKTDAMDVPSPFGEIPRRLRQYYESLQEEAIPDKFLALLERLDEAERVAVAATPASDRESN
jgi:hypothetical protein